MKVVILCGGLGSRLSEETKIIPKPMVKIGQFPILEHVIKIYEKYGFKDFILATGYKNQIIKNYFKNKKNIKCIFTGKTTMTGGRVLRLQNFFEPGENFMMTYGDGLTNQNLKKLVKFHLKNKKIATMTVVKPPARFGEVFLSGYKVKKFQEKAQLNSNWINGGFFVFNYKIFNYIAADTVMLERQPLSKLAKNKQLIAFKHKGFWQCMDTMRDKGILQKMWYSRKAPWVL